MPVINGVNVEELLDGPTESLFESLSRPDDAVPIASLPWAREDQSIPDALQAIHLVAFRGEAGNERRRAGPIRHSILLGVKDPN